MRRRAITAVPATTPLVTSTRPRTPGAEPPEPVPFVPAGTAVGTGAGDSDDGLVVGVFVAVGVGFGVLVCVGVGLGVLVCVGVGLGVLVCVGVGVGVGFPQS